MPALDLKDMRVPELAFFGIEGGVELGGDHVFDADETSVGGGGVVDEALADVVRDVGAVMVCFDGAGGVGGVDVECVEVCADVVYGGEALRRWWGS